MYAHAVTLESVFIMQHKLRRLNLMIGKVNNQNRSLVK